MSEIKCVPHETGISFTYDGVQYVYTAEGFFHVGEGGLQSLDESDVPLLVSELAEHWKSFSLRVRLDDLGRWLGCCEFCEEAYRVYVYAGLDYFGVRLLERWCSCGRESYSGWAARRGTGPRPTLEYVQVLAANVHASGLRTFFVSAERSRGTGPRATAPKTPSCHRRARACPSPSCVRAQSNNRGGQARALWEN